MSIKQRSRSSNTIILVPNSLSLFREASNDNESSVASTDRSSVPSLSTSKLVLNIILPAILQIFFAHSAPLLYRKGRNALSIASVICDVSFNPYKDT